MEYVSFAVETIIAILGLIITVIEVIKNRKEKRIENEKKEIFKKLTEEIKTINLDEITETIDQIEYSISDFANMKVEDIFERKQIALFLNYYKQCETYFISCNKFIDAIDAVYRSMVKNEDCFSLSYGFGRYIIVFREFISCKNLLDNIKANNNRGYAKVMTNFEEDKVLATFSQVMIQKMLYIYDARNENHEERIKVIEHYVKDETIGLNVIQNREKRDNMAWDGFNWIMNNKKGIQKLEEKRKKLVPIIREIQIKYDLENNQ